jgi:2-(1,2-epoxy-1,2-dihydrophenyl)acetyl-CoA isomerase
VSYQNILFHTEGGIARLTFNRPDRLNSFNTEMHAEVRTALATLPGAARVLVITGAGRGFCAGQDLNDRAVVRAAAPDLAESIERNYKPGAQLRALPPVTPRSTASLPVPVPTSPSPATGIAARARPASCRLAKLGLVPDSGGTRFLPPRLVGNARALGYAPKTAARGAGGRLGLIWRCVEDADLGPVVESLAQQPAAAPTRGLARPSRQSTRDSTARLRSSWTSSATTRASWVARDYAEGVAVRAKRTRASREARRAWWRR